MINLHLTGDIVRCPDISAIHKRAQEIKERHRICQYGYMEDTCQAWQQSLLNWQQSIKNFNCGRCMLAGCDLCPGHLKRKELGNKDKTYKIDNTVYRKMASAAHFLVKESKSKTLFITLTFPKFKRKVSDEEINKYFSKYVENLRTNYDCGGYIAVRERGKQTNRIHYHLLLSIPFVPFATLNDSWCNTIKDICVFSRRALTTDKKTVFIRNPVRALKYVCKYFAKSKGQVNNSRLVFMSNNILSHETNVIDHYKKNGKPVFKRATNIQKKYYESAESILSGYKSIFIQQTSDYSTSFRITDSKEFNRFCNTFLYPFFELSSKVNENLYSFPANTS